MLSLHVRPAISRVADPVATRLVKAGVHPDAVTLAGTVGVVASALLCFPRGALLLGGLLVTLFVLSDMIDGAMARLVGRTDRFGAWLDSTCDRAADAAVFVGLALWFTGRGDSDVLAVLCLYCLVAGSIVSYAKARAEGLGLSCDVGFAERGERLILVLAGALLAGVGLAVALAVALWLLAAATTVTVVQRTLEVRRQALSTS